MLREISRKLQKMLQHQEFMKYFKNTSWLFVEKILRMGVGLFVGVWVARYLGPEKFGNFAYAQSFVGLFTAFATLGLDGIVVRELVKDKSKRNELIGTAFWLKIFASVAVLFILAGVINFTSNDVNTNILIFIIASATIFQSFNVIDFYFQSKVLSKYVVYANVISLSASSILKIILILNKAPLVDFAWVVLFDSFVLASGLIYFYFKKTNFKLKDLKFNKKIAIEILKDSWPLMFGGMSFVIFSNIDTIMIKELLNEYSVGIYSAAYRLVTLWYFLPGLIIGSLLPSLVMVHGDKNLFNRRILWISTLLIWTAVVISIIYFSFGKFIIAITYGPEYYKSTIILGLLSIVNILIFYNSMFNQWMMVEGKTQRTLYFHLLTAIFNVALNYLFIRKYGIAGSVYALLGSLFLVFSIFAIFDRRIYRMFISAVTFKILWKKDEETN